VVAEVDAQGLKEMLEAEPGQQEEVGIFDSQGVLVYRHPEFQGTWSARAELQGQPLMSAALRGQESAGTYVPPGASSTEMGSFVPIRPLGWVAEASRPEAEAMAPVEEDLLRSFGLLSLVVGVALLVALAIGHSITGPIMRLRAHTLAVARGEMGGRVEIDRPSEVADLAGAFNWMVDELRRSSEGPVGINSLLASQTPKILWALIAVLSSILIFGFFFINYDNQLLATLTLTLVSTAVALVATIIYDMNDPFKFGFWAVSPTAYFELETFLKEH
jgi:HAMP domain-containing protein